MLASILATACIALGQSADLKEFRDAFALRVSDSPTGQPDPAIQKCMDLISARLLADVHTKPSAQKIQEILKLYSGVVQDEEVFETSYRSLGASMSMSAGKVAIGIRMGAASRLKVFQTADKKSLVVPKELDWSYQFDVRPQFLPGGMLVVDGPGIQDAGVRYGYRILFLRPGKDGYSIGQVIRGVWTLEEDSESHLRVNGMTASVNTIEEPKSFFTDNSTRLFAKNIIFEMDKWPFKVRMTSVGNAAIRSVDLWMAEAIANPVTPDQERFVDAYGKERQMIESFAEKVISEDQFEVTLKFEKTFVFTILTKGPKETVTLKSVEGLNLTIDTVVRTIELI